MFTVNTVHNPSSLSYGVRWVGSKPFRQIKSYPDKDSALAECARLNTLLSQGIPISDLIPDHDSRHVTALGRTLPVSAWCEVLGISLPGLAYHRKRRDLPNRLLIPALLEERGIYSLPDNAAPSPPSLRQALQR